LLITLVQSSVPYADLGVATSGVTFFRTIGGAFGAAIFGTLYANFLSDRLPAALAQSPGVSPADLATPSMLHALPASEITHIVAAYADALGEVFFWAAPVALIAFVLALLLPQVRLSDSLSPSASDLSDGFAAPESLRSEEVIAGRVANLLYGRRRDVILDLLGTGDLGLDAARIWALVQVHGLTVAGRRASVTEIAHARALPAAILEPVFAELVTDGFAEGTLSDLSLTDRGHDAISDLAVRLREWIIDHLEGLGPEDREAIGHAITNVVRRIVIERADNPVPPPSILPTG